MKKSSILCAAVLLTSLAVAQAPATGTPPFGTFQRNGFETVNLANLNVHLDFPIIHKAGRGIPFDYIMGYDSSVWYPVGSSGAQSWQPVANWGWQGQTEAAVGYVHYISTPQQCFDPVSGHWIPYTTLTFDAYHDERGVSHPFSAVINTSDGTCYPEIQNATVTTTDGSGFTVYVDNTPSSKVTSRAGQSTNTPISNIQNYSATRTDVNGNQLKSTAGSNLTFTDTLGATVLTVSGSGTPSSPLVFTYTAPSGAQASVTFNYSAYTVKTNFGITGIAEYGPTTQNLVSSISMPDGSSYTILYEATPGFSGDVTGRISRVMMGTLTDYRGYIFYTYTGSNNGIFSDGSTAGLTRVLYDGTNARTWTYARSGTNNNTDNVTDPDSNSIVYTFSGIYMTQKVGKDSAQHILETFVNCYNSVQFSAPNFTPCINENVTTPITLLYNFAILPQGTTTQYYMWSAAVKIFDSTYGRLTEEDDWDWATSSTQNTLFRKTKISYASLPAPSNGIVDRPSAVSIYDSHNGTDVLTAQTNLYYDTQNGNPAVTATTGTPQHVAITGSRGNLEEVDRLVTGTTYLKQFFTYYDTGTTKTFKDVNNAITTYNYGTNTTLNCGNTFPTSVSLPLSLSTSNTWNCTGAVPASATDANSKTTNISWTDAYFWRPAQVCDPTNYCPYTNYGSENLWGTQPNWASTFTEFNTNNSSTVDVETQVDGFGRPHLVERRQGPYQTVNTFDTVETDYASNGLPSRVTMPYVATGFQTNSTAPATTATYDALARPTQITDAGGGTVSYYYGLNDVLVVVGPAPGTESLKMRQYEYDAFGRLKSVCEISQSLSGIGPCGQNTTSQTVNGNPVAMNGYKTTYTYNALDDLTNVSQSGQSRSFVYDGLSRLTSETNPETGASATAYTYDTLPTPCSGAGAAYTGDLTKTVDSAGKITCFYYDSLHRLTDAGYSGPTCRRFRYDTQTVNGLTMANSKGRLARAYTDNCGATPLTDEGFSYNPRGELADFYESTPHSGGFYHMTATYWPHGALNTLSLPGMPMITYGGLDGEGRVTTITATGGTSPVTNVAYNNSDPATSNEPLGALLSQTLGSGDSDVYSYDKNTGRMLTYQFNMGSPASTDVGTLTWNANGSLASLAIVDGISGSTDSGTCNYSHDDLGRVASVSCPAWTQAFTYDAFGNIWKTGSGGGTNFLPTSYTSNQPQGFGITWTGGYPNKDSLGNTFTWGSFAEATAINSLAITYDAFGRLIEQPNGGGYLSWIYLPDGYKSAAYSGQTLAGVRIPLPAGGLAEYTGSPTATIAWYRHADWLGSSRLATTPGRTTYVPPVAYAPFGEVYANTGNNDRAFTGQSQNIAVGTSNADGLYDFMFREYSPAQGRWISPDPAGIAAVDITNPQSWNRYAYVLQNPLALIDPLGLCDDEGHNCGPPPPPPPSWGIGSGLVGGGTHWSPIPDPNNPNRRVGGGHRKRIVPQCPSHLRSLLNKVLLATGPGTSAIFAAGELAAALSGRVVEIGLNASGVVTPEWEKLIGGGGQVSVALVFDPQGNVGLALTGGLGYGLGEGFVAGGQISSSKATSIFDVAGPSVSKSVSLASSGGISFEKSNSGGGTNSITIGIGEGGFGAGPTYSYTLLTPLVCHQ